MSFSPSEERRVARLESDVEAIYKLLGEIQQTQHSHTRQLQRIDRRLDSRDERFDSHDQRFDAIDQRFDAVDQRFDSQDGVLAEILRRLPEAG